MATTTTHNSDSNSNSNSNSDPLPASSSTLKSRNSHSEAASNNNWIPIKDPKDQTVLDKLVTHHDSLFVHKFFGIACLISYVYRYWHVGERDANFGPHAGTLFFLVLHLGLNISSFIFAIPERRINSGFRIWPEYRIHSLVFCARSIACMFLHWCEQVYGVQQPYYEINIAIVLATCAAADYGSSFQTIKSPTIRGIQFFSPAAKMFFSILQFEATAMCLVGCRRYTIHLAMITIIQLNAFLMTLRRKNVANQSVLVSIYGFLLAAGLCLGVYDDFVGVHMNFVVGTVGNVAAMLRMGPLHLNKYILWSSLGVGITALRYYGPLEMNNDEWTIPFACSIVGMVVLGLWRRHHLLDCDETIRSKMKLY